MRGKEVTQRVNVGSVLRELVSRGKPSYIGQTVNFRLVESVEEKGIEVALGKFLEASQSFGVSLRACKIYA